MLIPSFLMLFRLAPVPTAPHATGPRIAFTAFYNGQWDVYSVSPDGDDVRNLTNDMAEEADPAYSPDGTRLAYAARRNNNWDIYVLNLQTGHETRLTDHPQYDGAPAWNPDGNTLAFESFRSGDLDIWLVEAAAGNIPRNLTADSPAGEFDPAWDGQGRRLFFASWRGGTNSLWALDLPTGNLEQLTTASSSDSQPAWDSTGQRLAFTRNTLGSSDVWMFDGQSRRYSWLGSAAGPAVSPDGTSVAAVLQGHHGTRLVRLDDGNPVPVYLTPSALLQGRLSWAASAVITGAQVSTLDSPDPSPLYRERLTPSASPHGEPYDLVRLNDLQTGTPWLADTVDDSYRALRQHVRREVGYDFLGEVSEALRPINFFSQTSQYSSWHKSGRAVDTLFDLPGRRMEIVRQNIGGETYWRIMLRCTDQSGRCGRPITVNAWDYSGRARTVIAPEQGGIEKPNLNGYYIDFTTLAEMYGWERISSWDDDDFSWTWHFKAFEYWHYQKKLKDHNGVSNWYQAMLQVYPKSEVDSYFTWDKMRAAGEDPYLVVLKGVPIPPAAERWWQQLVAGRNGTY